jgi:hypothetical protein
MLALVVDSAGLELTPLVVDMTAAGDSIRFVCSRVEEVGGDIGILKEAANLLLQAHSVANPLMKTNCSLFSALKHLKEFGGRYRKPELVSRLVNTIEELVGPVGSERDRSVFLEMLGLPTKAKTQPYRRLHRKQNKKVKAFQAAHRIDQNTLLPSVHTAAIPMPSSQPAEALMDSEDEAWKPLLHDLYDWK